MKIKTRAQMEAAIKAGRSVIVGTRVVSRVEDLPTEADIARMAPEQAGHDEARLDAEIQALQARRQALRVARAEAAPAAVATADPGPEAAPESESKPEAPPAPAAAERHRGGK